MTEQLPAREHLRRLLAILWAPQDRELSVPPPSAEVIELAHSEDIIAPLYTALQQAHSSIPDPVWAAVQHAYYQAISIGALHIKDIECIMTALLGEGVPALLLKGAALAKTLYQDVALRTTGDIDLVVLPQYLPACQRLLRQLGYVASRAELTAGAQFAYGSEQAFIHPETGHTAVELHWHLLDVPYYLQNVPMDWFWSRTETIEIAGYPVQILSAEANLLYLPAHLALHHRFHGLRWFLDLALLVHKHRDSLDWDMVIAAAQEFELLLVLRETLDRLAGYWPSLPLDGPRHQLEALQPTPFEQRLFHLLTTEPRSPLLDFCTDIVCLPDAPTRFRFVWSNLFPQRAYMVKRYKMKRTWELPYWYAYRLGDGLTKLARTLPQVIRLNRELP
jgi:hypothetical protein